MVMGSRGDARRGAMLGSSLRGALAGLLLLGVACASVGPLPPDGDVPLDETYVIGVTDQLMVAVFKNPELTVSVPVRSDGKISVPLLDDVQAAGLTPEELKDVVTSNLEEFITAPDVTIVVQETNSRAVSVVGAVGSSGMFTLALDMRVMDAIARAGGFNTWAKKNQVKVLRRLDGRVAEYRFNYGAFVSGKSPQSNFLLRPGDTVVVPD